MTARERKYREGVCGALKPAGFELATWLPRTLGPHTRTTDSNAFALSRVVRVGLAPVRPYVVA
jgi:hypothetical protein